VLRGIHRVAQPHVVEDRTAQRMQGMGLEQRVEARQPLDLFDELAGQVAGNLLSQQMVVQLCQLVAAASARRLGLLIRAAGSATGGWR